MNECIENKEVDSRETDMLIHTMQILWLSSISMYKWLVKRCALYKAEGCPSKFHWVMGWRRQLYVARRVGAWEPSFESKSILEEQEKWTTNSRCLKHYRYYRTNDIRQRHYIWLNSMSVKLSKSIMFFESTSWWLFLYNTHIYKKKCYLSFRSIQVYIAYESITEHIEIPKNFLVTHQILIYIDWQLISKKFMDWKLDT